MKPTRFDVFSSLMIAVVSIMSAVTAWRANAASLEVGDANFEGTAASIRAQEARVFNSILAYQQYDAFTDYFLYNALGDRLFENPALDVPLERTEFWGIAHGLQYTFFNSLYLSPDGRSYDVQRQIDELWAEANLTGNLNHAPHYEAADAYDLKGGNLTLSLSIFAASFFFFAVGQAIRNTLKYLFAFAGLVTMLGAICMVLVLEFSI
ncbi:MAG TPA: hypothetical protein VMN57_00995 [Anaerolineales bacterium]|nr:hypothetical protein [Anaerolineales bacterium]